MEMTNNEIVRSYREAKSKKEQIKILAQLNACEEIVIKTILMDAGEKLPYARVKPVATSQEENTVKPEAVNDEEPTMAAVDEDKPTMAAGCKSTNPSLPRSVYELIVDRMELLNRIINDYEKEYKELAEVIGSFDYREE